MPPLPGHFKTLLNNIEPSPENKTLAKDLPGDVRDWFKESDLDTVTPHTRLIGSYSRSTAILDIKDIDILLFYEPGTLERTPESVLRELKSALDDYPDATADASPQRRSIHLAFDQHDVHLDIVAAVAENGLDDVLEVPDRAQAEWIESDPLGYGKKLSRLNDDHGGKAIPLVKLAKAWRDVQMKTRKIKSYLLEIMIFNALDNDAVETNGVGIDTILTRFFEHIRDKHEKLMDEGTGVPRIYDPQTGSEISKGWERSHFETFMRRIREAAKAARKAIDGEEAEAKDAWSDLFGDHWPTDEAVNLAILQEAKSHQPGLASVTSAGIVNTDGAGRSTGPTRFHGDA